MPREGTDPWMPLGEFARRIVVATLIVLSIYYASKGLWRIKELLALLFIAFTLAAAMRPGDRVAAQAPDPARRRRRCSTTSRSSAFVLLLLWLVVPRAVHQVDAAVERRTRSRHAGEDVDRREARHPAWRSRSG